MHSFFQNGGDYMATHLLIATLALVAFLAGLHYMRKGLEGMMAGRIHLWIDRLVHSPTRGILSGTIATGFLQSSSAVTAIAVGLVSSDSMTFRSALGLVLGANVGSTIAPQLLRFNLSLLAIPAMSLSIIGLVSRQQKWRAPAVACAGLATIVLALAELDHALAPLSHEPFFLGLLKHGTGNLLMAMGCGALASAVIQSSTATTLVTMSLANDHLLTVQGAVAIVLGANIGTCLTSVIAAIGQNKGAQQVALSHVLLNGLGVALALPFIPVFAHAMSGTTLLPAAIVANAHTLFNLLCTLLVWPFVSQYAHFVEWLLPNRETTS
jgi:phosphate:Na+ symporter